MRHFPSSRGVAIISTLAVVTVLTLLLLSFLVSMQTDRQSTSNYSQSIKAKEVALSALQEITSSIQQEIDAGSKADGDPTGAQYTTNGQRIYIPKTNKSAAIARGGASTDYATDVDIDKLPPSLIRISGTTAPSYSAANYDIAKIPHTLASAAKTTDPSANKRSISTARWNKPLLMGASAPTIFTNNPPQWIYMTRSGSRICTDDEAKSGTLRADAATSNTNAILGRYAYVFYNEGSLLDVNVAGCPATVSATSAGFRAKSYTAYADLTQISPQLTHATLDNLINWRNMGGLQVANGNYQKVVELSAATGFLYATTSGSNSDNPILSRQDMLDYFKKSDSSNYQKYVPYLGTFSRTVNAPSWCPTQTTPKINYAAIAETGTSANRNVANVRASDGTPLIKKRFPLSRLALVTDSAIADTSSDIYKYFGLQRASATDAWTYSHGDPNHILSLEAVRTAEREPDFFELLKAAILKGSVGLDPGAQNLMQGPVGINFEAWSKNPDGQIIQIGADIIDQFDTDSYPTTIYFQEFSENTHADRLENTAFGEEDLPYLNRIYQVTFTYQRTGANPANPYEGNVGGWLQPQVWNPHQQPNSATLVPPTDFRITSYGAASLTCAQTGAPTVTSPFVDYTANPDIGRIHFSQTAVDSFRDQPNLLTISNAHAEASAPMNQWKSSWNSDTAYATTNKLVGICTGTVFFSPVVISDPNSTVRIQRTCNTSSVPVTLALEYKDANGNWRPYNLASRLYKNYSNNSATHGTVNYDGTTLPRIFYARSDPRTDRFSMSESFISGFPGDGQSTVAYGTELQNSLRPNNKIQIGLQQNGPKTSNFTYQVGQAFYYIASWAENLPSVPPSGNPQYASSAYYASYSDPDGVTRPGDGYRSRSASGTGDDGWLLYHTKNATGGYPGTGDTKAGRRPVILNRPFRSVGELGYAYRDLPYKTLDFWSKDSADAALLDFFCLEEEPEIVAGAVDLNSASVPVLKALLLGATKKETDPSLGLTITDVDALAPAIANYISTNGSLMNRSDLVITASGTANLSQTLNDALSSTADKANKAYGEAPVRALSSVTNFRTWNLLIDVIAQSGRMIPNAKTVNDFLVEGERRYWLHIAIDRYTGKVVDQQLEPVYE